MAEILVQIINGCIKGEKNAQAALYNMYCRKMMGLCMWYAKNKQEAEEILQDGFMLVFSNIHKYANKGSFEGWIRRIMINAALAKYRGKKSNVMHLVIDDAKDDPGFAELPLTESLLEEKELLLLIQGLTPVYRMVFNLYVLEGFKHKEIAEQLGITEGTSKSNLADARAILRKKIIQQQKTLLG